jgi:nicotinate-nucleotide adenylyltransferase
MPGGRKIAIFGGTFDPIHRAHLTVAREAMEKLGLDEILFIPAANPPHKTHSTAAGYEDRYRMVELACRGLPGFTPSRLEEGRGKSYSILTIGKLKGELAPDDRIHFLVGADAFAEIGTWHRWREVIEAVEFIVVTRPGHEYEVPPGARVHRLETVALPVSSSEIRAKLAAGEAAPELPGAVLEYVREKGLYRQM